MENNSDHLLLPSQNLNSNKPRPTPKRFIKNQIPGSITNDSALNAAISLLPANYSFEVHKCIWRIQTTGAKRVALQFPEGLLMYSLVLSDIFKTFGKIEDCFVLGDVTYGACCVDDFSATALNADLLIHYGHSCLIPIDSTKIPSLYVFVEIKIDVDRLIDTIKLNMDSTTTTSKKLALAGTIQFSTAIRAAKSALENAGFEVLIPQSKPLSAGEVLGCTSPTMPKGSADVVIFVADGRVRSQRNEDMRKNAILKAREARSWGIVLGTLGRQGNPKILERLLGRMRERGFVWTVILMSEISPARVALFGESIDAWIQIACPRLSIDWGEAFAKPLLTPFEAEIALGFISGWWEKSSLKNGLGCEKNKSCCMSNSKDKEVNNDTCTDYPMDYYAQDGGEWNCAYSKKSSHPPRRNLRSCTSSGVVDSL
ncbi:Diphthamide synthesis [Macleaya cordata]|uniref:2-(3-amino-3-carboxypropyl)histidine synthase subunit 1 n=1 Tax=Macleaya cordata TaxID=56857 RepID=A0A200PTX4_MACCD|nr:Diphthamide synthesis [Macleaya cordata]